MQPYKHRFIDPRRIAPAKKVLYCPLCGAKMRKKWGTDSYQCTNCGHQDGR